MKQRPERKPDWLKVRFPAGPQYARIDRYHRQQGLHSVCRSAACPNQGECWSRGVATFMILGDRCTRNCTFCNVAGAPPLPVDAEEPFKVASAAAELGLKHAVVTSVTRDDLADGGAAHFAALVEAFRSLAPGCRVELLIPDLGGNLAALHTILAAGPDILGHNIETVPRFYPEVRQGASYSRSLQLLREVTGKAPQTPLKTGIMLGLGEEEAEVVAVLRDLRDCGVELLTIGQYLAPSRNHHPVRRYVPPAEFAAWKETATALGFAHVEAGPLVRSSYHAEEQFEESLHVRIP
ncbi:lipoyl synthase [Desulfuromonas sp. AOP6]|uniref:lipoyl synthase n=1 Tax=Desulfuromonas sp. AOP6 TaxID=1566351 RepID=UPI001289EF28|nr:lipoyl synthase [Desulfuromonas sp. AOP6]BCA78625.1 lipoyl synthase 2 [Desulfuromonas sp. AOP6]